MAKKNMRSRAPIGKAKRKATAPKRAARPARQSKAAAERVLRKGPIRKRAAEQAALPEMENMGADRKMDDICKRIATRHVEINDLRRDDAADYQLALSRLRTIERTSYNRHGVEMVRVPGEEKLRVRTKGEGAATGENDEPADPDTTDVDAMDAAGDDDSLDADDDAGNGAEV